MKALVKAAMLCAACILIIALVAGASGHAASSEETSDLIQEQEVFAERFLAFLSDVDAKHFARAAALNGTTKTETKQFSYDFADYEARVARGPVVEKIGRLLTTGKKPVMSFQKPTVFSRHLIIDVHPKSPFVGTLHMTLLFQYEADGTSAIMSWFDVMSGANRAEDLAVLRQAMDDVFAEHDTDVEPFRQGVCTGEGTDIHRARRKSDYAGLSFQGRPALEMTEENFQLVTDAFERFLDAYFMIVELRKDEPFSTAEVTAQASMRRDYFHYNLTSDLFFSSGYPPFEVWSLIVAPPTVNF